MDSVNGLMRFVSLQFVADVLTTTPADVADVLRSEKFSDAGKAAFGDFMLAVRKDGQS